MDFGSFLARLDEAGDELGGPKDIGAMMRGGKSSGAAFQAIEGITGSWGYVATKTYLGGKLKPFVVEHSENNWGLYYCAKGVSKVGGSADDLVADSKIPNMVGKRLNEMTKASIENAQELEGWTVAHQISGPFDEILHACVDIVTGGTSGGGEHLSSFKKALSNYK
jgi:hypothetical protein